MKPRKHPRTGAPLARTICNRCGRDFPGRVLRADAATCPDCTAILDRESKTARFAPAKRGPLTSAEPSE